MSITSRISLQDNGQANDPEDYFGESLGVVFPDDVTNLHGDAEHSLLYTSPHLPEPLHIDLNDPGAGEDRKLFSHFLWNASLQLAELIEADTLGIALDKPRVVCGDRAPSFDVGGLDTLELGAGTALPSIMAGLLGARRVAATDYPADPVIKTLRDNVGRNMRPELAPAKKTTTTTTTTTSTTTSRDTDTDTNTNTNTDTATTTPAAGVEVHGHIWGECDDTFGTANAHAFDRVMAADCLWMPWQHANLQRSVAHYLRQTPEARCWAVAGFHTGTASMRGFFDAEALRKVGLEVESIWERDCNGEERPWDPTREEDITVRKRWLACCSIRWIQTS